MYIQKAVSHLKEKKIILYPTDTIWGIGGDATSEIVIDKIHQLKLRSKDFPFIILVDSIEMLKRYIPSIPAQAKELLNSVSPVTIIYPKSQNLSSKLVAKDGSVGIRIVKTKFCRDMIHDFGKPVISTSANLSGQNHPSEYTDIDRRIIDKVDYVVPLYEWTGTKVPSRVIRINEIGHIETIRH